MGAVKVDIYKGEYEWHYVNLSSVDSVKGLLKYRYRYDLLFDCDNDMCNVNNSFVHLNDMVEEIICTYTYLDELINCIGLTDKQMKLLNLYMRGYTEEDLAQVYGVTQQLINKVITGICKKIHKANYDKWLNEFIYWDKKKVETDYKQCIKCGEWLPKIKENFGKDERNKDNFQSVCKKCDSLRKKK